MAIDLIEEAVSAGARRFKACAVLEIDVRTLQRWQKALQEREELAVPFWLATSPLTALAAIASS